MNTLPLGRGPEVEDLPFSGWLRKMRKIGLLRVVRDRYNAQPIPGMLFMANKAGAVTYPCVVEFIPDSEDFQVSILRQNNADINSYVESRVRASDPMFNTLKQKVSILIVSGDNEEIEGIGVRYTGTFFAVLLNKDEHDQLLK